MKAQIVLTGSQVYGPATLESDINIVMHVEDAEGLKAFLEIKRIGITEDNGPGDSGEKKNTTFYFRIGELKFNIICVNSELELNKWEHATKNLLNRAPIYNREERCREFKKGLI